jgi:hypothetical protein
MSDETNTSAIPQLPAPAEQVKPDAAQPAPAPADDLKPEATQPAPARAAADATVESAATQQSPAITRAPTRVARGVTRSGAPHTAAAARPAKPAAKPAKPAAPAKAKVPDYRKLKLNADDVIGGVRKVNPWKEGTKGHGYYAKYRTGMTVAEAVKAGVPRGYVAWDVAHGFITLKSGG